MYSCAICMYIFSTFFLSQPVYMIYHSAPWLSLHCPTMDTCIHQILPLCFGRWLEKLLDCWDRVIDLLYPSSNNCFEEKLPLAQIFNHHWEVPIEWYSLPFSIVCSRRKRLVGSSVCSSWSVLVTRYILGAHSSVCQVFNIDLLSWTVLNPEVGLISDGLKIRSCEHPELPW
jgi:hypothetical protein